MFTLDNFKIDIIARSQQSLLKALEIAFAHNNPGGLVASYEIKKLVKNDFNDITDNLNGKTAFILRWIKRNNTDRPEIVNFSFNLDVIGAADFAMRWLAEQDYGYEPDHDGDNEKGWRIYTGAWGHIDGDHYAICAIMPEWAMYGK